MPDALYAETTAAETPATPAYASTTAPSRTFHRRLQRTCRQIGNHQHKDQQRNALPPTHTKPSSPATPASPEIAAQTTPRSTPQPAVPKSPQIKNKAPTQIPWRKKSQPQSHSPHGSNSPAQTPETPRTQTHAPVPATVAAGSPSPGTAPPRRTPTPRDSPIGCSEKVRVFFRLKNIPQNRPRTARKQRRDRRHCADYQQHNLRNLKNAPVSAKVADDSTGPANSRFVIESGSAQRPPAIANALHPPSEPVRS